MGRLKYSKNYFNKVHCTDFSQLRLTFSGDKNANLP